MSEVHEEFDHNASEFRADPLPYYKQLREAGTGQSKNYNGLWYVPTYAEVTAMAHNTDSFSPAQGTMFPPMNDRPMLPMESDPPLHTEYRHMLMREFAPKAVAEWAPTIRETARSLLEDMFKEPPFDLGLDYAKLLPTAVICKMLGITFDPVFQQWVEDSVYRRISHPKEAREAVDSVYSMFRELLPKRRANPGNDLVSLVLTSEIEGEVMDEERVLDFCFFLLVAGLDNTNFTIRALLHQMAIDQELQKRLIENPDDIPAAVEESLRFFSPVIALGRHATQDVEFAGCPIRKGEGAVMLFGCANRDPQEFEKPDEFDIDRFPNRHVAFGVGPHRCLGSNLARVEIAIAIEEVLKIFPGFKLAEGAEIRYDDLGPLVVVAAE